MNFFRCYVTHKTHEKNPQEIHGSFHTCFHTDFHIEIHTEIHTEIHNDIRNEIHSLHAGDGSGRVSGASTIAPLSRASNVQYAYLMVFIKTITLKCLIFTLTSMGAKNKFIQNLYLFSPSKMRATLFFVHAIFILGTGLRDKAGPLNESRGEARVRKASLFHIQSPHNPHTVPAQSPNSSHCKKPQSPRSRD